MNHYSQTILHHCIFRRCDNRILLTLWNTILSPQTHYTMDFSAVGDDNADVVDASSNNQQFGDMIYTILFHKDAFGLTLWDYIELFKVKEYAPEWVQLVQEQYQLYQSQQRPQQQQQSVAD